MRLRFAALLLGCVGCVPVMASGHWSGEVGTTVGATLEGTQRVFQRALYLHATVEHDWNDLSLRAKGRALYDTRYEGRHPYSDTAESAYRFTADWRHAYLATPLSQGELTLGWQQVVWGRADELRVLDQINPVDYRFGVTTALQDSRMALPMARYTRALGDWEFEGLLLGHAQPNKAPAPGSEFDSVLFAPPDPSHFEEMAPQQYGGRSGWSPGASLNGRLGAADVSVVALRHRPLDPVYVMQGIGPDGRQRVQAQRPQYTMLGSSAAWTLDGGLVARNEIALFHDWAVTSSHRTEGVERTRLWKALFGVDYLYRDRMFTGQWQLQRLTGWHDGLWQPRQSHMFTLSTDASHDQDRWKSRFLVAWTPPAAAGTWLQAQLTYRPSARWRLSIEANGFIGRPPSTFGSYDRRDHLRLSLGYQL